MLANMPTRTMRWAGREEPSVEPLLTREWLVTNGLGGYASRTVAGVATRRYHGLLIAAMPAPMGRMMILDHLAERIQLPGGRTVRIGAASTPAASPCTARSR